MADVFTKAKRSEVMSRIRGRGNKNTELALVILFRRNKISGWRRNQKSFGKPDFVFPKLKLTVFVDGCFWHGCPRCYTRPKSNQNFWDDKVVRNRQRDKQVSGILRKAGWRVIRIWEHSLAKRGNACVRKIQAAIAQRTIHSN